DAIAPALVAIGFGMSAEVHIEANVRPGNFPRIAEAQPLIRDFNLPAVADLLIEDSEFIADAVSDRRNLQRRQRFHEPCGQASETAVAEARLFFVLDDVVQIQSKLGER